MAQAINISELNTKLGAYFRKDKETIISEMLLPANMEDRFEVWDDCSDEVVLPSLEMGDLVKPANNLTFSPNNDSLNFKARIAKVRSWKVDLLIVPGDLYRSWLGKFKKKGSDPFDIPLEQFIIDHIIAKVQENIRLKALYKGVYNAAGTTPIDIMNGLLTLVANEITAGNVAPITTGVITAANVLDKILLVHDSLGEAYKAMPTETMVSSTLFDWVVRKFVPVINANLVATDSASGKKVPLLNEFPIPGTNTLLVREAGFGTSQRILCTPKENKVYLTDSFGEENNIRTQEFERTIKLMIDAKSGVDFKEVHSRALAVNEQV